MEQKKFMDKTLSEIFRQYSKKVILSIIGIIVITAIIWIIIVFAPYVNIKPVNEESLNQLSLDGYNKLMIVAHPDDELLWGGAHLIEDDYLVVCITNGKNKTRKAEFEQTISDTSDKGLILSYPDKIGARRSNWGLWKDNIEADLATIINYKDWEIIVTHNEYGEYGHKHHIMTHELVDKVCERFDTNAAQYYFSQYYTVDAIPDGLAQISNESYKIKKEIAKNYQSQYNTFRKFYHMMPYEIWSEK